METQDEDYEFEERAAIREFEAGQPRDVAELLARDDIEARTAQQNCLNHRQQYRKEQQQNEPRKEQQPVPKKQELQSLRNRRDEVSKKMTAEKDPKRKNELFAEWKGLIQKIFEIIDKGV